MQRLSKGEVASQPPVEIQNSEQKGCCCRSKFTHPQGGFDFGLGQGEYGVTRFGSRADLRHPFYVAFQNTVYEIWISPVRGRVKRRKVWRDASRTMKT
jgi:hypothetical protein